ncbi:MAG: ABC transporter permease [Rhizobiaceae bacterium]|jgi:peptide/nickel transport system permease protein|nr:ABC transporter permease [Rhizobiaceae bacterium]
MQILTYIGRRLIFVGPQLIGILLVTFLLLKLIPGDPAVMMLGPFATDEGLARLRAELGLDRSIVEQFGIYLWRVLHWDLGTSWQTTMPVTSDLAQRFPATLELVTLSLLLALAIGLPLGVVGARNKDGIVRKFADYYGLAAGALPDFWFGLVLIFVFYTMLGMVPAPLGRIDFTIIPPPDVTGSLLIDSLISGNWPALKNAAGHLILPVLTLGIINAAPILKMTVSTMERMLEADFSRYAEMCGLPRNVVARKALRNSLPSIITIVSVLYGFLIGGAVLVEIVFSWGGAGQYAVQGVLNADLNPVLGFVLYSAILSLVIYLIVDLIYFAIDPRMR